MKKLLQAITINIMNAETDHTALRYTHHQERARSLISSEDQAGISVAITGRKIRQSVSEFLAPNLSRELSGEKLAVPHQIGNFYAIYEEGPTGPLKLFEREFVEGQRDSSYVEYTELGYEIAPDGSTRDYGLVLEEFYRADLAIYGPSRLLSNRDRFATSKKANTKRIYAIGLLAFKKVGEQTAQAVLNPRPLRFAAVSTGTTIVNFTNPEEPAA